ncbi:MAG: serine/threonine-protein kinase [Eubacteriales bacterium]|nr:serine/threonine-protein kinase [Eubacteriales bacterium]
MTNTEKCALSCYREIAVLDAERNISVVQHTQTGSIFIRKTLDIFNAEIYRYLLSHYIKGTPAIAEAVEQDGKLVVIEEYVYGQTLRSILDNGNLFSNDDAIDILSQLCEILVRLHGASPPILHRDIKPSNIILTPDGSVKLLDMNAARQVHADKTEDTALIGTVGYAAPEQYGFSASTVQTDIYSCGVLLCELVTGGLPKDRLPSGRLAGIVKKCTRMDPKARYKSAQALLEDLTACRSSHPVQEPGTSGAWKYTLPGFRSKTPTNMLVAVSAYIMLFWLGLTFTAEGILPGTMTVIERTLFIIFGLLIFLFSGNYLEIWSAVRITRIKNPWLRTLAVLAADLLLAFIAIIFMTGIVVFMGQGS